MPDSKLLPQNLSGPAGSGVQLRRLIEADLPGIVGYRSEPAVARHQGWTPEWNLEDARRLFANDQKTTHATAGHWVQVVIISGASGELCGDLGVHFALDPRYSVELGVTVARPHQRRGIVACALRMVVDWLFADLVCHRIFAQTDARNIAPRALFSSLGFRH